jgi:hypothetical protein
MNAPDVVPPGDTARDPLTAVKLALAWSIVGIPLAWGVWQVFQKSLALFR